MLIPIYQILANIHLIWSNIGRLNESYGNRHSIFHRCFTGVKHLVEAIISGGDPRRWREGVMREIDMTQPHACRVGEEPFCGFSKPWSGRGELVWKPRDELFPIDDGAKYSNSSFLFKNSSYQLGFFCRFQISVCYFLLSVYIFLYLVLQLLFVQDEQKCSLHCCRVPRYEHRLSIFRASYSRIGQWTIQS